LKPIFFLRNALKLAYSDIYFQKFSGEKPSDLRPKGRPRLTRRGGASNAGRDGGWRGRRGGEGKGMGIGKGLGTPQNLCAAYAHAWQTENDVISRFRVFFHLSSIHISSNMYTSLGVRDFSVCENARSAHPDRLRALLTRNNATHG
jgi:hypothetical protein